MKTAHDYQIESGRGSLKFYKYFSIGLKPYKTKARVIEALNLGIEVCRFDKIMERIEKWDGDNWSLI